MSRLRIVVTRPLREAEAWVRQLQSSGCDAIAVPLIAIAPVHNDAALRTAWAKLPTTQAAMFVSSNAVRFFFASATSTGKVAAAWPATSHPPRAWATGPGTAQSLRECGVAPGLIDSPPLSAAQFDSEALWQVVAAQILQGGHVLIVRGAEPHDDETDAGGASGRDWLARKLQKQGATVDQVVAYQRLCPNDADSRRQWARQAASPDSVWLFSSSLAIRHLAQAMPEQDWRAARAIATHARIAQAARDIGFGVVCESRPRLQDVIASIESLQ